MAAAGTEILDIQVVEKKWMIFFLFQKKKNGLMYSLY